MALLLLWGVLFLKLIRRRGAPAVFGSVPFQLFVVSAGGVLILPSAVLIPGFLHSLAYIAERMSLGVGVCVCALLGLCAPARLRALRHAGAGRRFLRVSVPRRARAEPVRRPHGGRGGRASPGSAW